MGKGLMYLPDGQDFGSHPSHFGKDFGFTGSAQHMPAAPHHHSKPQVTMAKATVPAKAPPMTKGTKAQTFAKGGEVDCYAGGGRTHGMKKGAHPIAGALGKALGMAAGKMLAGRAAAMGGAPGAATPGMAMGRVPVAPAVPMSGPPPDANMPDPGAMPAPIVARKGGFIKGAIKHPGRMKNLASKHGVTVHQEMEKDSHSKDASLRGAANLGLRLTGGDLSPHKKKR